MNATASGTLAATLCYAIWGLSPAFYKLIARVGPAEVLAHRTLWSVVAFGAVLALAGRLREVAAEIAARPGRTVLAALLVGANWFLFIFAVSVGQTVQSALGYYLLPIAAVLAGRLLYGEALGPRRILALGAAALGVALLGAGGQGIPWIALGLTATFLAYTILKKSSSAGPLVTVLAEALILLPLALGFLAAVHLGWRPPAPESAPASWSLASPSWAAFGTGLPVSAALVLAGPMTALPLLLFSFAARRIELGRVGFLIYVNSTLQFALAILLFGEALTLEGALGFAAIWIALALYVSETSRGPDGGGGNDVANSRGDLSALDRGHGKGRSGDGMD